MYTFLKAEWKTITALVIFCGIIYAWFYAEEVRKEENKNKPYVFECLRAGKGILEYELGTPLDALTSKLQTFKRTEDPSLNLVRYERPDGAIALNFRFQKLASVEFYPDKTEELAACTADADQFLKTNKIAAEPIQTAEYQLMIYEGMNQILKMPDHTTQDAQPQPYGWIALAP